MKNFFKTNWLSILLLIFIIAAGFFAFQWWQVRRELVKQIEKNENLMKQISELQKEIEELKTSQQIRDEIIEDEKTEVTITTDKREYKQGEKVRASLDYDGSLYVWGFPSYHWFIQRKVNNSWIDLKLGFIAIDFFSHCEVECRDVPLNKISDCISCRFEAPAWDLINGRSISFTWNQKHITSLGTYQCYQEGKIISRNCVIYEEVPPGEYKIRLEYALNIKNRMTKEGANIKYAEKEFKIVK